MGQRQLEGFKDVAQLDRGCPSQRADRASRASDDEVGAMAGNRAVETEPRDQGANRIGNPDGIQVGAGARKPFSHLGLLPRIGGLDPTRIHFQTSFEVDHLHPLVDVGGRLDFDAEAETIEQLRPQLSFLRVHRSHQDEMGGMDDRHPFALDHVDPHRRGVEQDVHQVVIEQVDLVHIEKVAVRLGKDSWLEPPGAGPHRGLDVDGTHQPVFGGIDRQLDDAHRQANDREWPIFGPNPAVIAVAGWQRRVAAIKAALDRVVVG